MIIEKNTAPEEDKFYEYPYHIARIQQRFINTKRQWFKAQYRHHRIMIEELDNAYSIHAFNRFEEKGYVECFQCHFRLVDIPRDAFYALVTPGIKESPRLISGTLLNFYNLNDIIKSLMSTSLIWANCFSLIKNVRDKHAKIYLWEFAGGKEDKDNIIQNALKVSKVFEVKPLRTPKPDVPSKKAACNLFCKDI